MDLTAAPQALTDRADIEWLLVEYANAVDDRDFDRVAACFTPDAQASYNGVALDPGVGAIVAHISAIARFAATSHNVSNVQITVDGDHATARSAAVAWLVSADEPAMMLVRGLRYDDRLVRTGNGWRIAERVHRARWMWRGRAEVPGSDAVERALGDAPTP